VRKGKEWSILPIDVGAYGAGAGPGLDLLPLTHNVVRLFKLIHLSTIERARMIHA
jgi:hypothetical protein